MRCPGINSSSMAHCCCAASTHLAFGSAATPSRSSRCTIKSGKCPSQQRPVTHLTDAGEQSLERDSHTRAKTAANFWESRNPLNCKGAPFRAMASWTVNHNFNCLLRQLMDYFARENCFIAFIQKDTRGLVQFMVKKKERGSFFSAINGLLLLFCWLVRQTKKTMKLFVTFLCSLLIKFGPDCKVSLLLAVSTHWTHKVVLH